jgi:hypothetical protein
LWPWSGKTQGEGVCPEIFWSSIHGLTVSEGRCLKMNRLPIEPQRLRQARKYAPWPPPITGILSTCRGPLAGPKGVAFGTNFTIQAKSVFAKTDPVKIPPKIADAQSLNLRCMNIMIVSNSCKKYMYLDFLIILPTCDKYMTHEC